MSKVRQRKVSTQISRILGQLLVGEARDERFHHATITEVDISPDLGHAKVYVSIFANTYHSDSVSLEQQAPSQKEQSFSTQVLQVLNKAAPWFQQGLGKELRLRRTPKITFVLDSSAAQYAEIDALLKKASFK